MAYTVRLDLFEGPLDLLLYLIRKDEIEIADIPIARITEQYLGQLEAMQTLELDSAGEYLLMAATLMRIKSRMLLPRKADEEDEDPRLELVNQLLEYRKYKEIAGRLSDLAKDRSRLHDFIPEMPLEELRSYDEVFDLSFVDMMSALRSVMGLVAERESRHRVRLENVTLDQKLAIIREKLQAEGRFLFRDFFAGSPSRLHLVVTFMAMLELIKLGEARVMQQGNYAEIWIQSTVGAVSKVVKQAATA